MHIHKYKTFNLFLLQADIICVGMSVSPVSMMLFVQLDTPPLTHRHEHTHTYTHTQAHSDRRLCSAPAVFAYSRWITVCSTILSGVACQDGSFKHAACQEGRDTRNMPPHTAAMGRQLSKITFIYLFKCKCSAETFFRLFASAVKITRRKHREHERRDWEAGSE